MTPITDKGAAAIGYGGGAFSILSSLTLSQLGAVVGILTALGTLALSFYYKRRNDKREQEYHEARMERERERRQMNKPVAIERRKEMEDEIESAY